MMGKFDKIVIVTDLDGTFLNDKEGLVERNLRAIEYFKQNGGHFTVATGRVAHHALVSIPRIAELVNMPIISCNGACVYDTGTGEVCETHQMSYALAADMVRFIHKEFPDVGVRAGAHEYCFMCTPEDTEKQMIRLDMQRYAGESFIIRPLEEWEDMPILKIAVRGSQEDLAELLPRLMERFGESIAPSNSWPTTIDVMPAGVNKGVPLDTYIRSNMPEGTVIYACGDYINDRELLERADVAVCPSGAHESIKAMCELCLCSNNEGLIADVVEYIERGSGD